MTNAEYYKEQLKSMENKGYILAVRKGKPQYCSHEKCRGCDFLQNNRKCEVQRTEWLNSEHK